MQYGGFNGIGSYRTYFKFPAEVMSQTGRHSGEKLYFVHSRLNAAAAPVALNVLGSLFPSSLPFQALRIKFYYFPVVRGLQARVLFVMFLA